MSDRARAEADLYTDGILDEVPMDDDEQYRVQDAYLAGRAAGWKARGEADLKASKAACAVGDNHWAAIRALDADPETKEGE